MGLGGVDPSGMSSPSTPGGDVPLGDGELCHGTAPPPSTKGISRHRLSVYSGGLTASRLWHS